jgi:CHAT domain-containing protein/tetratricopeptide (TPR) repeat protein
MPFSSSKQVTPTALWPWLFRLFFLLFLTCLVFSAYPTTRAHTPNSSAQLYGKITAQEPDPGVKTYLEGKQLAAQGTAESLRAAVEKFKQAARLFHAAGKQQEEGACLTMAGSVETALGENQIALEHFNQALTLLQAVGDRSGEANALGNIATIYDNLGEKQKAREYAERALQIFRILKDRVGEAAVLSNLGKLALDLGEPHKAIEYFNQSLPIRRQTGDRAGEGATLVNLGTAYNILGDRTRALDYYNQALPLLRAAGDRRLEAIDLSNIGLAYDSLGDKQRALDYFEQTLIIQRAVGDRFGEGTTLNNIGLVHASTAEFQKALEFYNRALTIARAVSDRRVEAISLSNIGALYYSMGENQKALDYYNQSLPLKRAIGDRIGEAITLNNIGSMLQRTGQAQPALNYYNQALVLLRAAGDSAGQATTLNNIGELYWELGENQKAIDSLNQTLRLRRAVGDRLGEAITLSNIALVYDRLGEKTRALEIHEQALGLARAVADRSGEALTLFNIALIEKDRDRLTEALVRVKEAIAIVESLRTRIVSQELRSSYFATVRQYYDLYVDILMRLHKQQTAAGYDALALQASEQGRARSLLELLTEAGADIREGVDARLLERERALRQRLNAKARERMKAPALPEAEGRVKALSQDIEDLSTELQQVEIEIRRASPRYANLTQPAPLTAKEIQTQVLDEDTLLLEYSLGEDRSYLWAVTSTSITSYELPKRSEIEAAARQLHELVSKSGKWDALDALRSGKKTQTDKTQSPTNAPDRQPGREKPGSEAALPSPEAVMRLSQILLAPVTAQMGNKRLLIVADGALQYIPFGALSLPTADPALDKYKPLIVDHEIVTLPSASTLAVLRREVKDRPQAVKAIAVLADPVFESDDPRVRKATSVTTNTSSDTRARTESRGLGLEKAASESGLEAAALKIPRLPGTRDEARQILALVPANEGKQALDFSASRQTATSADLSQYRYVHFATHGFLDSLHPELSGIVLSLIDEKGNTQDGFLRSHEVYNLKLPAELVVLSACQTGLGKEVKGEGLVGLTRGFMYAGAPRVVVSLWSVNDQATAELMARFYRGMLRDKLRPAAALRAAQISLMKEKDWVSPFFWAAFTLQGEWR